MYKMCFFVAMAAAAVAVFDTLGLGFLASIEGATDPSDRTQVVELGSSRQAAVWSAVDDLAAGGKLARATDRVVTSGADPFMTLQREVFGRFQKPDARSAATIRLQKVGYSYTSLQWKDYLASSMQKWVTALLEDSPANNTARSTRQMLADALAKKYYGFTVDVDPSELNGILSDDYVRGFERNRTLYQFFTEFAADEIRRYDAARGVDASTTVATATAVEDLPAALTRHFSQSDMAEAARSRLLEAGYPQTVLADDQSVASIISNWSRQALGPAHELDPRKPTQLSLLEYFVRKYPMATPFSNPAYLDNFVSTPKVPTLRREMALYNVVADFAQEPMQQSDKIRMTIHQAAELTE